MNSGLLLQNCALAMRAQSLTRQQKFYAFTVDT